MFLSNAQYFSYWQNLIKSPGLLLDIQNFKTGHPTPTPLFLLKWPWFKTKATCVVLIFNPAKKNKDFFGTLFGVWRKRLSLTLFIRMLQLEKTLLCKQSSECAFCLWVCLLYWCRKCQMCIIYYVYPCNSLSISALRGADLWRWTGRSTIIMHRQLGHFIFLDFYLDLSGGYRWQRNLLHWKPEVGSKSDPQFFF